MEYEQNKATKLVQMLDSSEMQYKQFWIARTRKAILLWCLCFALIAIATVFIIFGLRERNKYVEYSLHYKKTQSASDDANKLVDEEEDRNASIYDKVGTIKPPKDIEGYELGGEYYNSSNADYILAPESNIANSLTYENSIYTSYRLKYYRLTISSDVNSSSVEFDSGKEKVGFANTFFIVPTDILSTQDVNTSVLTSPYTNDHLYKLYSASVKKKTMTSGTKFSDVDGRSGYHISAFYYNLPDRSVKYSFQPVIVKYDKNATGVSSEASLTHGYSATTYLVTKTITTLVDGKTTILHTFSNGAEPLIDSKTNTVMSGQMENDMNVYYTTGYVLNNKELVDVNRNANLFKMLSTDVNFYVEWEVDDRYLIAVDLTDEHTFNSIFTSPSEIPYNLDYSQISDRIAAAINDDKTDDWDNLTNVLTNLRDNNGNKIPVDINTSVFLGKVVNGDVISDRITRYLKYGQEVQYKDGDAYYPFAKAGYSIEGKKAEYINWEVLTKEGKWIAATTIKNELSDNCIIIRPKWKADEYTINFTAGENAVIEVTNKNVFKSSSFKGNVEICAQLIQESGVDAKISKLGNRLVGWQLHANLYFNSTVGGVGYPNIAASSDDVKNIIVPSTNIKFHDSALTFKDYEYENYKYNEKVKVARVEETIEEKTIVYNFYYFVDDIIDNNGNLKPNDTVFQMPKGYYSDTKDVNVNAVWEVIKYSITIDFNITKNDVTELTADADQIILADWEDDQIDVAYRLGFDYVYGLAKENGYKPFADKVWNEYPFNVKNNDIDTLITNIGYRKGVTTDMDAVVTIPYIVDTPLYLPKQGEIYRLGYTLVGYEIYNSSDIYNSEKIAKFDIANDSRQIILCSTESDNGIVLRTNKFYVYEDIFIKPVWKPLTIEVDVPKNSQSNEQTTDTYSVINAKSVINYNKENTEITENTYQVVLKNIKNNNIIQNIQILDPHNTAAKDYFSTEATNTTFFSGTAANIYVRLNDYFNTSTFSMDITLSDGLNSYKYTLEDAIDIALGEEFDEDKDYGIFNILDKNSAYYKRFTDKVWSEDVVYTTHLYPTELMSRYYIDYGEDGGKQPALATISISIAEEIGEGWYNIQFQNVAMDMEFALSQISYTLIQNSFMTHPHQYAEDEYKYSLSSLSAYMDSLRANGDCDSLTTRINNQEIEYNFVPEQWYMVTRWDELVDILEYNRLHDNKIEYVLVNHFKTIDIYNILDFGTDYEDMEYKLAKHNDPNLNYNIYAYKDNNLYFQALRLLGGNFPDGNSVTLTNYGGAFDTFTNIKSTVIGELLRPNPENRADYIGSIELFAEDTIDYVGSEYDYGVVYAEPDTSIAYNTQVYIKDVNDIDDMPMSYTTKLSNYIQPGKTEYLGGVEKLGDAQTFNNYKGVVAYYPTAQKDNQLVTHDYSITNVVDNITQATKSTMSTVNSNGSIYYYSSLIPDNAAVKNSGYKMKFTLNSDIYNSSFWLYNAKNSDGSFSLIDQYALVDNKLEEVSTLNFDIDINKTTDRPYLINVENKVSSTFSLITDTATFNTNSLGTNKYVYSLHTLLNPASEVNDPIGRVSAAKLFKKASGDPTGIEIELIGTAGSEELHDYFAYMKSSGNTKVELEEGVSDPNKLNENNEFFYYLFKDQYNNLTEDYTPHVVEWMYAGNVLHEGKKDSNGNPINSYTFNDGRTIYPMNIYDTDNHNTLNSEALTPLDKVKDNEYLSFNHGDKGSNDHINTDNEKDFVNYAAVYMRPSGQSTINSTNRTYETRLSEYTYPVYMMSNYNDDGSLYWTRDVETINERTYGVVARQSNVFFRYKFTGKYSAIQEYIDDNSKPIQNRVNYLANLFQNQLTEYASTYTSHIRIYTINTGQLDANGNTIYKILMGITNVSYNTNIILSKFNVIQVCPVPLDGWKKYETKRAFDIENANCIGDEYYGGFVITDSVNDPYTINYGYKEGDLLLGEVYSITYNKDKLANPPIVINDSDDPNINYNFIEAEAGWADGAIITLNINKAYNRSTPIIKLTSDFKDIAGETISKAFEISTIGFDTNRDYYYHMWEDGSVDTYLPEDLPEGFEDTLLTTIRIKKLSDTSYEIQTHNQFENVKLAIDGIYKNTNTFTATGYNKDGSEIVDITEVLLDPSELGYYVNDVFMFDLDFINLTNADAKKMLYSAKLDGDKIDITKHYSDDSGEHTTDTVSLTLSINQMTLISSAYTEAEKAQIINNIVIQSKELLQVSSSEVFATGGIIRIYEEDNWLGAYAIEGLVGFKYTVNNEAIDIPFNAGATGSYVKGTNANLLEDKIKRSDALIDGNVGWHNQTYTDNQFFNQTIDGYKVVWHDYVFRINDTTTPITFSIPARPRQFNLTPSIIVQQMYEDPIEKSGKFIKGLDEAGTGIWIVNSKYVIDNVLSDFIDHDKNGIVEFFASLNDTNSRQYVSNAIDSTSNMYYGDYLVFKTKFKDGYDLTIFPSDNPNKPRGVVIKFYDANNQAIWNTTAALKDKLINIWVDGESYNLLPLKMSDVNSINSYQNKVANHKDKESVTVSLYKLINHYSLTLAGLATTIDGTKVSVEAEVSYPRLVDYDVDNNIQYKNKTYSTNVPSDFDKNASENTYKLTPFNFFRHYDAHSTDPDCTISQNEWATMKITIPYEYAYSNYKLEFGFGDGTFTPVSLGLNESGNLALFINSVVSEDKLYTYSTSATSPTAFSVDITDSVYVLSEDGKNVSFTFKLGHVTTDMKVTMSGLAKNAYPVTMQNLCEGLSANLNEVGLATYVAHGQEVSIVTALDAEYTKSGYILHLSENAWIEIGGYDYIHNTRSISCFVKNGDVITEFSNYADFADFDITNISYTNDCTTTFKLKVDRPLALELTPTDGKTQLDKNTWTLTASTTGQNWIPPDKYIVNGSEYAFATPIMQGTNGITFDIIFKEGVGINDETGIVITFSGVVSDATNSYVTYSEAEYLYSVGGTSIIKEIKPFGNESAIITITPSGDANNVKFRVVISSMLEDYIIRVDGFDSISHEIKINTNNYMSSVKFSANGYEFVDYDIINCKINLNTKLLIELTLDDYYQLNMTALINILNGNITIVDLSNGWFGSNTEVDLQDNGYYFGYYSSSLSDGADGNKYLCDNGSANANKLYFYFNNVWKEYSVEITESLVSVYDRAPFYYSTSISLWKKYDESNIDQPYTDPVNMFDTGSSNERKNITLAELRYTDGFTIFDFDNAFTEFEASSLKFNYSYLDSNGIEQTGSGQVYTDKTAALNNSILIAIYYDLDTKEVKLYLKNTTLYADFTINIYGFEDRNHEIKLSLDGFHNFSLGGAEYDSTYGQYLKYTLNYKVDDNASVEAGTITISIFEGVGLIIEKDNKYYTTHNAHVIVKIDKKEFVDSIEVAFNCEDPLQLTEESIQIGFYIDKDYLSQNPDNKSIDLSNLEITVTPTISTNTLSISYNMATSYQSLATISINGIDTDTATDKLVNYVLTEDNSFKYDSIPFEYGRDIKVTYKVPISAINVNAQLEEDGKYHLKDGVINSGELIVDWVQNEGTETIDGMQYYVFEHTFDNVTEDISLEFGHIDEYDTFTYSISKFFADDYINYNTLNSDDNQSKCDLVLNAITIGSLTIWMEDANGKVEGSYEITNNSITISRIPYGQEVYVKIELNEASNQNTINSPFDKEGNTYQFTSGSITSNQTIDFSIQLYLNRYNITNAIEDGLYVRPADTNVKLYANPTLGDMTETSDYSSYYVEHGTKGLKLVDTNNILSNMDEDTNNNCLYEDVVNLDSPVGDEFEYQESNYYLATSDDITHFAYVTEGLSFSFSHLPERYSVKISFEEFDDSLSSDYQDDIEVKFVINSALEGDESLKLYSGLERDSATPTYDFIINKGKTSIDFCYSCDNNIEIVLTATSNTFLFNMGGSYSANSDGNIAWITSDDGKTHTASIEFTGNAEFDITPSIKTYSATIATDATFKNTTLGINGSDGNGILGTSYNANKIDGNELTLDSATTASIVLDLADGYAWDDDCIQGDKTFSLTITSGEYSDVMYFKRNRIGNIYYGFELGSINTKIDTLQEITITLNNGDNEKNFVLNLAAKSDENTQYTFTLSFIHDLTDLELTFGEVSLNEYYLMISGFGDIFTGAEYGITDSGEYTGFSSGDELNLTYGSWTLLFNINDAYTQLQGLYFEKTIDGDAYRFIINNSSGLHYASQIDPGSGWTDVDDTFFGCAIENITYSSNCLTLKIFVNHDLSGITVSADKNKYSTNLSYYYANELDDNVTNSDINNMGLTSGIVDDTCVMTNGNVSEYVNSSKAIMSIASAKMVESDADIDINETQTLGTEIVITITESEYYNIKYIVYTTSDSASYTWLSVDNLTGSVLSFSVSQNQAACDNTSINFAKKYTFTFTVENNTDIYFVAVRRVVDATFNYLTYDEVKYNENSDSSNANYFYGEQIEDKFDFDSHNLPGFDAVGVVDESIVKTKVVEGSADMEVDYNFAKLSSNVAGDDADNNILHDSKDTFGDKIKTEVTGTLSANYYVVYTRSAVEMNVKFDTIEYTIIMKPGDSYDTWKVKDDDDDTSNDEKFVDIRDKFLTVDMPLYKITDYDWYNNTGEAVADNHEYINNTLLNSTDLKNSDWATIINIIKSGGFLKANIEERSMKFVFNSSTQFTIDQFIQGTRCDGKIVSDDKQVVFIYPDSGSYYFTLVDISTTEGEYKYSLLAYRLAEGDEEVGAIVTYNGAEINLIEVEITSDIANMCKMSIGGINTDGTLQLKTITNGETVISDNNNTYPLFSKDGYQAVYIISGEDVVVEYSLTWKTYFQIHYNVAIGTLSLTTSEYGFEIKDSYSVLKSYYESDANTTDLPSYLVEAKYKLLGAGDANNSTWVITKAKSKDGKDYSTNPQAGEEQLTDAIAMIDGTTVKTGSDYNIVNVTVELVGTRGSEDYPFLIGARKDSEDYANNLTWHYILNEYSKADCYSDEDNTMRNYFLQTGDFGFSKDLTYNSVTMVGDLQLSTLPVGDYDFYGHYYSNYEGTYFNENNPISITNDNDVNYINIDNTSLQVRPLFGRIVDGSIQGVYVTSSNASVTTYDAYIPDEWKTYIDASGVEINRGIDSWGTIAISAGKGVNFTNCAVGSATKTEDNTYSTSYTIQAYTDEPVDPLKNMAGIVFCYEDSKFDKCQNAFNFSNVDRAVGITYADEEDYPSATFTNCTNYGNITADYESYGIAACVVPISNDGSNPTLVQNCINYGNLTATTPQNSWASGIVGYAEGTITDCYNYGNIDSAFIASGIAIATSFSVSSIMIIKNCENYGNISSTAESNGCATGISGGAYITNCTNNGSISVVNGKAYGIGVNACGSDLPNTITDLINTGEVTAQSGDAYGIGYIRVEANSTITDCYNTGNIIATNGKAIGLIDINTLSAINISNCYNTGAITATNSDAVGVIDIYSSVLNTTATIIGCYNTGVVKATNGDAVGIVNNTDYAEKTVTEVVGGEEIEVTKKSSVTMTIGNTIDESCYNEASITATNGNAVGLVNAPYSEIKIINCENKGNITTNTSGDAVGVVIANHMPKYADGSSSSELKNLGEIYAADNAAGVIKLGDKWSSFITDCSNAGEVLASGDAAGVVLSQDWGLEVYSSTNSAKVTGNTNVAGIVVSRGLVKAQKCTNTTEACIRSFSGSAAGIVNAGSSAGWGEISDCDNSGAITGSKNAVGIAYYDSDVKAVKNCGNTGEIKATAGDAAGIVITNTLRKVSGCYNTANISANDSGADITAAGIAYVKISRLCDNMSKKQNDNTHPCYVVCNCEDAIIINNVNGGIINYGVDDSNNRTLTCDTNGILTGYVLRTDSDIPTITTTSTTANVVRIGGIIPITHESFEIKGCINNTNINFKDTSASSSYIYAGGVVANITSGDVNISDCKSYGTIQPTDESNNLNAHLGGVVGHLEDKLAVKNIYEVDATTGEYIYDDATGEQILVKSYTIIPKTQKSISITNTTFGGTIKIATADIVKDVYAGGLIGSAKPHFVNFSVTNCDPTVTIDTKSSGKNHSGGLIGYSEVSDGKVSGDCIKESDFNSTDSGVTDTSGNIITVLSDSDLVTNYDTEIVITTLKPKATITSCSPTRNITATGGDNTYAGGLIGCADGDYNQSRVVINNCNPTVTIVSTSTSKDSYAGGLVGRADCVTISESSVTASDTCTIQITASANNYNYIGGLIGGAGNVIFNYSTSATPCSSRLALESTGGLANYLGGLIGNAVNANLTNLEVASVTINANNIDGNVYAGGLVGILSGFESSSCTNNIVVNTSITASSINTSSNVTIGGLVGQAISSAVIEKCYVIIGTISATSAHISNAGGLVGVSQNSTITNCGSYINVEAVAANTSSSIDTEAYCGGLVGCSENSTISYCSVDKTTTTPFHTIKASADTVCVGGLVGSANASTITNDTYIAGSKTYAKNVAITIAGTCENGAYMGGLVGKADALDGTICTISNCYTDGITYTMNADDTINNFYFGGLVGYAIADISSCEANNINVVLSEIQAETYAGGLVGYIDTQSNTTIEDSSASGSLVISVSSGYRADVGGLIGWASATSPYTLNITSCNSTTSIDSTCVDQNHMVGGLIGYISSFSSGSDEYYVKVTGCYYSGDIDASNTSTSSSSIVFCGGLVGYSNYADIQKSYVYDNSVTSTSAHSLYYGGIAGWLDASKIENCYFNNVDSGLNKTINLNSNLTGSTIDFGGVVGYSEDSEIYNSYSATNVTLQAPRYITAGGIVGDANNLYVSHSYSWINATITSSSYVYYGGIVGSTTGTTNICIKSYYPSTINTSGADGYWNISGTKTQKTTGTGKNSKSIIWDTIVLEWDPTVWFFPDDKNPIFLENSEGMTNEYTEIWYASQLNAVTSGSAGNLNKYILKDNITVTNWSPKEISYVIFLGDNKTINYTLSSSLSSESVGFFSTLGNAIIKDLNLIINGFTGKTITKTNLYFGGLAGKITGASNLINCHVTGNVGMTFKFNNYSDGDLFVGGMIGDITPTSGTTSVRISQCSYNGSIEISVGKGWSISSGGSHLSIVGGLIGNILQETKSNLEVDQCSVLSNFIKLNETFSSQHESHLSSYLGGLIGYIKSTKETNSFVSDCRTELSSLQLVNNQPTLRRTGGLVGFIYLTDESNGIYEVENCHTNVVIKQDLGQSTGGVFGGCGLSDGVSIVFNIIKCTSTGRIETSLENKGQIIGEIDNASTVEVNIKDCTSELEIIDI